MENRYRVPAKILGSLVYGIDFACSLGSFVRRKLIENDNRVSSRTLDEIFVSRQTRIDRIGNYLHVLAHNRERKAQARDPRRYWTTLEKS